LNFGQNKSCGGTKDLQHWYWAKVDLSFGLGRKMFLKLGQD